MPIDYLKQLKQYGYCELFTDYNEFLTIGGRLGTIIPSRVNGPLVDQLVPKKKEEAHPNSLSRQFGLMELPFHNDGAYFYIPPHYIVLRYVDGIMEPTPTMIIPILECLQEKDIENLKSDIWIVKGRTFNFYSSILNNAATVDDRMIRFDVGCMKPAYKDSCVRDIINGLAYSDNLIHINWRKGLTLILDNWKILHARPAVREEESNFRTIQRMIIE
jgi:hypothetical protein